MPVYKRGDVWHYDFTVDGERFRGSTGARLKEDALKIEAREHRKALVGFNVGGDTIVRVGPEADQTERELPRYGWHPACER